MHAVAQQQNKFCLFSHDPHLTVQRMQQRAHLMAPENMSNPTKFVLKTNRSFVQNPRNKSTTHSKLQLHARLHWLHESPNQNGWEMCLVILSDVANPFDSRHQELEELCHKQTFLTPSSFRLHAKTSNQNRF